MQKIKRRLRSLTVFSLTIMCFVVLMGQSSSEGQPTFAKSIWQYFMEEKFYLVIPAADGYSWRKMHETQKYGYITGYVRGFEEGVVAAWTAATGETRWPFDIFAERIPYDELVEAVDGFYSDYANRGVYLSFALPIIISRISGYISDEEAEERIQTARRSSLKIRKQEQ